MKTYTFAGGSVTPGFVLSENEGGEMLLALGEYGRGSWLTNIPLNSNPENRPEVSGNMVTDTFLLNVGGDQRPFFVMLRDRGQNNGSCLIRLLTVGESGEGNGFVQRISGFRSRELVSGHGRNNGIVSTNGTWSDSVWVVHEGELLRVQLAGCDKAFAVRVKNSEPTVEPWVNRESQQRPVESKTEPKSVPVSGNSNGGRHGGNPHQTWRALKGSHVVSVMEWNPGINDAPQPLPKIELDAEIAKLGRDRVAKKAKYHRQSVAA
ncbi:MAG: hypothetical protein AAB537_01365 [Patescibacteria group bacterium]